MAAKLIKNSLFLIFDSIWKKAQQSGYTDRSPQDENLVSEMIPGLLLACTNIESSNLAVTSMMANFLVCLNLASYTLCLILAIHTVSKFSNT